MKLASITNTSRARLDQLRRDCATAQALGAALPKFKQLRIDLRFEAKTPSASVPTAQSLVLYPAARAFFQYRCPYADCDGNFDLQEAVNSAQSSGTNVAHGVIECRGSRCGTSARRPCLLQIHYDVALTCGP